MNSSDNYEIINNHKYKKCKENQIRNPVTKKCVLKDNKLGKKIISMIENQKVCPEDKILNIATNKCVSKKSPLGKKLLNDIEHYGKYKKLTKIVRITKKNKIEKDKSFNSSKIEKDKSSNSSKIEKINQLQKKIKTIIYPFINRVSANIYDRKLYYFKLMRYLKHNEKDNYCIKLHSNTNKQQAYSINNTDIILTTNSYKNKNYLNPVFIGTFNKQDLQLYKFAVKIAIYNIVSKHEITVYDKLADAIINDRCPHFPLFYTSFTCKYPSKIVKINEYPNIIKYNQDKNFILILTELANGNFSDFITSNYKTVLLIKNAIAQIFLSLCFFYYIVKSFHKNTSWNNFLYHKIKPGGFFHYKIFNKDYYIENLGYLWVINDFSLTTSFIIPLNTLIDTDFNKFIREFKNTKIKINNKPLIQMLETSIINLHDKLINYHHSFFLLKPYSIINIQKLINKITQLLSLYKFIDTNISDKTKIINKNPYVISNFE